MTNDFDLGTTNGNRTSHLKSMPEEKVAPKFCITMKKSKRTGTKYDYYDIAIIHPNSRNIVHEVKEQKFLKGATEDDVMEFGKEIINEKFPPLHTRLIRSETKQNIFNFSVVNSNTLETVYEEEIPARARLEAKDKAEIIFNEKFAEVKTDFIEDEKHIASGRRGSMNTQSQVEKIDVDTDDDNDDDDE